MDASPAFLDGNAAAGPMADVLGFDITTAVGRCLSCGTSAVLARCRVYSGGPGLVMRCSSCDYVLARLVVAPRRTWLEMTGIACLQIERPS